MPGIVESRTYFLTGCASGIGHHLCERLIGEGQTVFATDINIERLRELAAGWPEERVRIRQLDVRDPASWAEAMADAEASFGRIEVLMNIAGYMLGGWAHEATQESIDRHLDINVKGVIFGTQAAARHMIGRGGGHIINMSSLSALAPIPGIAIYSASKYAVRAFSLASAQELRPYNIFVTAISPDAVRTPLLDPQRDLDAAAIVFSAPKLLTVEEIAHAILDKALLRKPLEIVIPAHRGWLAHISNIFPKLTFALGPIFRKRGADHQREFRRSSGFD